MDLYGITQNLDAFNLFRKGVAKILNPLELTVTVFDSTHFGDSAGYSKEYKSNYELAEIQINGSYDGGTPRPFMFYLKELLDNNDRHHVKPIIERNMTYDRSKRGWWVDWEEMANELQPLCERILAQDVSPMLAPVKKETQKRKTNAGYGNTTLYATGQLFQAVSIY